MGPVSKWPDFFAEARDRGYNMLHWTPLQERGESNSPYSIKDQLRYEPSMFDDPKVVEEDGGITKMEELLALARDQYGLLNLTDVVLNHTANNSPWLEDHPEAGKFAICAMSFVINLDAFSCRLQSAQLLAPYSRSRA